MGLVFVAPQALLVALVGLVPLAVALERGRAARRLRRTLELGDPPLRARLVRPVALASVFVLLGLAAAQPSVRLQRERRARSDAEVIVALDNSRSMLASARLGAPQRFERARTFARRLHADLPDVPMGLSSLSNRLLPYVFPTTDRAAFERILDEAYGIERPAPSLAVAPQVDTAGLVTTRFGRWVTQFAPLNQVAARAFWSPSSRRRILVVLSDAETQEFASRLVLRHLGEHGITPVVVRFWGRTERVFHRDGTVERYRSTQPNELALLRAAGWPAFSEAEAGRAVRYVRSALGSGPETRVAFDRSDTPIAPMLALAALAPLLLLLLPAGRVPRLAGRRALRAASAPGLAQRA